MASECCSASRHEVLRGDRDLFEEETDILGWQRLYGESGPIGVELEMRTCKACRSTLTDGTRRKAPRREAA